MTSIRLFRQSCLAAIALSACTSGFAQTPTELLDALRQLQQEMKLMKAELDVLKGQHSPIAAAGTSAPAPTTSAQPAASAPAVGEASEQAVSLFGYGELHYSRPRNNPAQAMATARRGVLGFAYRFNDRTRFAAELEIENAVVSASDQGEVAFEQLYIEHDIHQGLTAKAGLFLLPIGYMNESHEPTRYHGVTRNLVETAIIPTTWREIGVGLQGSTEQGLRWNAGMVTGFDLNKWPADSAESKASPLGSIHQEGQLAKAASAAYYGALNHDGIPGLNIGASLYSGGIGQRQSALTDRASLTLGEMHIRWQPGAWDLSALAAQGQFRGVGAFNASSLSASNPVPDRFRGWYAQAAYRLWKRGDYRLVPFARYERINTALGYSGLPPGLVPANNPDTRVVTAGASFYLHPQVVLKVDTQKYPGNASLDRMNVGLGFHY